MSWPLLLAATTALASPLGVWPAAQPFGGPSMHAAANRLIQVLSPAQRETAILPFESSERETWNYVPMMRKGLALKEMGRAEREALGGLLSATLSTAGLAKVEAIRSLEDDLRRMENGNPNRDPELYWVTVFGTPGHLGMWGFRFEGHHVSLNYTFRNGELVASTPQFLGANPARVGDGPHKGLEALKEEQELAWALIERLSPEQRLEAVTEAEAPAEIITSNARQADILAQTGIPYAHLDADQKQLLQDLVRAHAEVQSRSEAERRLKMVLKSDPKTIRFAWMGPTKRPAKHYYRIQGKHFLIEYDNTQNSGNHIHAVWREFHGDFGRDVLREHVRHEHQHPNE